jgi:hypothetical protein
MLMRSYRKQGWQGWPRASLSFVQIHFASMYVSLRPHGSASSPPSTLAISQVESSKDADFQVDGMVADARMPEP